MWFEARKQERKIRSAMVDHKRRQERRRNFYERIRKDPTEFMQLHGRQCKIYVDPSIAQAAESAAILRPWQGDPQVLIDRFDARSHLDTIVEYKPEDGESETSAANSEERRQEKRANYERYRILVLNDFEKTSEEKYLKQIYMNEYLGGLPSQHEDKKKKQPEQKAAIAYVYEDSTGPTSSGVRTGQADHADDEDEEELDEDELAEEFLQATERRVDITTLSKDQWKELNNLATNYSVAAGDFAKFMWEDHEEDEYLQQLRDLEQEKANLSGKQSRRERKLLKEVHARARGRFDGTAGRFGLIQPLRDQSRSTSANRSGSGSNSSSDSDSDSGNSSAENGNIKLGSEKVEYITSFGGTEDNKSPPKPQAKTVSRRKRSSSSSSSSSSSRKRSRKERPHRGKRSRSRSVDRRRRSYDKDRTSSRKRDNSRDRRHLRRSPEKRQRHRSSTSSSSRDQRRDSRGSNPPFHATQSSRGPAVGTATMHRESQGRDSNGRSSDSEGELSMLTVRSSMSESEQERRQIENTKRRLKNTKRKVKTSAKIKPARSDSSKMSEAKSKNLSLRERLALQTQKALKKTVAKDKEEENKRKEEILREQMEREEEMREMTNLIRQKEREKRDREVEEETKAAENQGKRGSTDRSDSRKRSRSSSSSDSVPDSRRKRRSSSRHAHRGYYRRSRSRSRSHRRRSSEKERSPRRSGERSRHDKRHSDSRHRSRSRSYRSRSRDRDRRSGKSLGEKVMVISAKKLVDY